MNCWEFNKCGASEGKPKENESGPCPVYPLHGKHCASVVGTYSDGQIDYCYVNKLQKCKTCAFYKSANYDTSFEHIVIFEKPKTMNNSMI